jgi:hypothetical protein
MHHLPEYDFAGPTTRDRVTEHNNAVAALEADQADVEKLAGELANLDPMTVAPDEAESKACEVARRRHANVKATVALLQARLPILAALEENRRQAEQEAGEALEQRRNETEEGLKAAGYAHFVGTDDPVTRRQAAELVDASSPVISAAQRFGELREGRTALSGIALVTRQEIARLTATLQTALETSIHGEPRRSFAAV